MPDTIDRASIFRQRRLLLAATFALVAFHFLRATLSQHVSTPIVDLDYQATRFQVGFALWSTWAWGLIRYYQYEKSFTNDALDQHRAQATERVCVRAISIALQQAVDEGSYRNRNLMPGTKIEILTSTALQFQPLNQTTGWVFPSIPVKYMDPSGDWNWLDGGANLSFTSEETIRLQRAIEIRLFRDYPHFTDFKVPYVIAALAPIAALVDFTRLHLL